MKINGYTTFACISLAAAAMSGCSAGDPTAATHTIPEGYDVEYDESVPILVPSAIPIESGVVGMNGENTRIAFVGATVSGIHHTCGFREFDGKISVDPQGVPQSIEVTLQTASLFSDDHALTDQLKSQDFFHIEEHPQITFVSTSITPVAEEEGGYEVSGELTMLGASQEIGFSMGAESDGEEFLATTTFPVDRIGFGMTYGEGEIESEVEVTVRVGVRMSRFGG